MNDYKGLPIEDRGTFYVVQCAQGDGDWWTARAGIPTASDFGRILTPKTLKPSASQDPFINELIAERVSLNPNYLTERGRPVTKDMSAGIELEPEARRFFELETGESVQQVGFCLSKCCRYGCSPDGLLPAGGLELKCPTLPVQIGHLRAGTLPDEYRCQVHGAMIVTGFDHWFFLSYNPSVDPLLIRVERDDFTAALEKELLNFCDRFAEVAATLRSGRLPKPALVGAAPTNDEERF